MTMNKENKKLTKNKENTIQVGDLVKVKPGRTGTGWFKFRGPYKVENYIDII